MFHEDLLTLSTVKFQHYLETKIGWGQVVKSGSRGIVVKKMEIETMREFLRQRYFRKLL